MTSISGQNPYFGASIAVNLPPEGRERKDYADALSRAVKAHRGKLTVDGDTFIAQKLPQQTAFSLAAKALGNGFNFIGENHDDSKPLSLARRLKG